jgi:hypothetical protein
MRYFMAIIPSREYLEGTPPPVELMEAMGPYMEKAIEAGSLISTAGLTGSAEGIFLRARDGRIAVLDGPFAESKEVIGGYAIMEFPSKAAAIEAATEFVNLHIENGVPNIDVQVRPIDGGYNF